MSQMRQMKIRNKEFGTSQQTASCSKNADRYEILVPKLQFGELLTVAFPRSSAPRSYICVNL